MREKVKSLTSAIVSKNISEEISLASACKLLHSIIHWDNEYRCNNNIQYYLS